MRRDCITVNAEVEVPIEDCFDIVEDEALLDEVRNRGYRAFTDSSDFSDQSLIDECAHRILDIQQSWDSNEPEENVQFISKVMSRVFQLL